MEGGAAVAELDVGISAVGQEFLDDFGLVVEDGVAEGGGAEVGVGGVEVGAFVDSGAKLGEAAFGGGAPDVELFSVYGLLGLFAALDAVGVLDGPHGCGDDGRHACEEGEEDAEGAVAEEASGASAAPEHRGEESGEEEEDRHPEGVDELEEVVEDD